MTDATGTTNGTTVARQATPPSRRPFRRLPTAFAVVAMALAIWPAEADA